jgi:hypothetical protein
VRVNDFFRADPITGKAHQHLIYGGGFEALGLFGGNLSLTGEFDVQETRNADHKLVSPVRDEGHKRGWAAYANATVQMGPFTVLGEFKNYDSFQLRAAPWGGDAPYELFYHRPPTLERFQAAINNNHSVRGGRLRIDYDASSLVGFDLTLFANHGQFRNWNNGLDFSQRHDVMAPYGGFEVFWQEGQSHAMISGGRRDEHNRTTSRLEHRDDHLEATFEQVIAGNHSVRISGEVQWRETAMLLGGGDDQRHRWREITGSIKYKWSPWLSVAAQYQRQEDARFSSLGKKDFYSAIVQYYFNSSNYVVLTVGSNKPGILCAAEGCRQVAAFNGVRLLFVNRLMSG